MNGATFTLVEVFGIKIKVNVSWAFIALLLAWALAQGYFPSVHEGLPQSTYWAMGALAVFGLFLSLLLHELSHSVVAQAFGMEIKGITLWLLGGVAEMSDEPPSPRAEFLMAIAGPLMSIFLALVFYAAAAVVATEGEVDPFGTVLGYLSMLNMILAAFNLVPAFPMDGGRVARAILWAWKGDLYWATGVAARMGSLFGLGLIALGVIGALTGAGLASLWWVVLGMFIRFAADSSRYRLQTTYALKGTVVGDYMTRDPVTVDPQMSIADLIENWIYRHAFEYFPVVDQGRLIGSISLREVKMVPPAERERTRVGDVLVPASPDNTVHTDTTAEDALSIMQNTGNSLLPVVSDGHLVGVIAMKDLGRIVAIKAELYDGDKSPASL